MTKQQTINDLKNLVGKEFQLFGMEDLDNEMISEGASSIFDELSISEFIEDEKPCWTFMDDETEEVFYIGVTYKITRGNAKEASEKYLNDEIEEWLLKEEAEKTFIEVLDVEEI